METVKEFGPYTVDPLGHEDWALEDAGYRAIRKCMREVSSGRCTKAIANFTFMESAIPMEGFRVIIRKGPNRFLDYQNDFRRAFNARIREGDERYQRRRAEREGSGS